MIQHIVLLDLPETHDPARLADAMRSLASLVGRIPGVTGFHHGPNRDYEGKSGRYPYGFILSVTGPDALAAYAAHPEHKIAGAALVDLCTGGHAGIFVADLDAATP